MCITVSRRGKCFCDGQPCATVSVRRMAKSTLKEFIESQKVSEVSNTSPNARICEDMVISRDGHSLLC